MKKMKNANFDEWWHVIACCAKRHDQEVGDQEDWKKDFELGKPPDGAFYDRYPEHD